MKFKTWLYLAGGVLWGLIPAIASAALVPCGQGSEPTVYSALSCDLCGFGQLVQNIINFLVGISIPISVIMFGWAGILMFTSAGDPGRRNRGRDIFKSVFIGFVLVITGWLIVQTVLSVIVDGTFFIGGKWNNLQCVDPRIREDRTNVSVSAYINSVLGTPPLLNSVQTPSTPVCMQGIYNAEKEVCIDSAGHVTQPAYQQLPTSVSGPGGKIYTPEDLQRRINNTKAYEAELRGICQAQGFSSGCTLVQAEIANESNGDPNAVSPAGCIGLVQICPGTAIGLNPSLGNLSRADLVTYLKNPTNNMNLAVQLNKQLSQQYSGDPAKIAAAYNGGPGANETSVKCGGGAAYMCLQNVKWAETRSYVPNITNTISLINSQ